MLFICLTYFYEMVPDDMVANNADAAYEKPEQEEKQAENENPTCNKENDENDQEVKKTKKKKKKKKKKSICFNL